MFADLSARRGLIALAYTAGAGAFLWSSRGVLHSLPACAAEAGFAVLLCGFVALRQSCGRQALGEIYAFSYFLALGLVVLRIFPPVAQHASGVLDRYGRAYFLALLAAVVFARLRMWAGAPRTA